MFVASGTPEAELNTIVSRRGLASYFTAVRGSPTPKQKLIADILSAHALLPERVLMIGDALIDYQSAQVNKVAFVGRVRPGDENPFPPHVDVIPDLKSIAHLSFLVSDCAVSACIPPIRQSRMMARNFCMNCAKMDCRPYNWRKD